MGVDVLFTEKPALHKQKLKTIPERNLRKDADHFIKTCFFSRYFCYIFALGNRLAGFSTRRLASVEDIFNVYIIFKCNCICEYKRLFIQIYLSSMLRKILFLFPHLFCNVKFEFSWFCNTKESSEIYNCSISWSFKSKKKSNISLLYLITLILLKYFQNQEGRK